MEGYYNNYLINSTCYKKLSLAISKTNTQISKVKKLINVFSNATGNNIDNINNDLNGIQSDLTNYVNMLQEILDQLVLNAAKFDKTLNEWKEKIGKDYKKPEVRSGIQQAGLNLKPPIYYEKVGSVNVNEKGYINAIIKRYLTFDVITDISNPNNKTSKKEEYDDKIVEIKFQ